eukprot:11597648-Prorocentrum_lima.AAC.1
MPAGTLAHRQPNKSVQTACGLVQHHSKCLAMQSAGGIAMDVVRRADPTCPMPGGRPHGLPCEGWTMVVDRSW